MANMSPVDGSNFDPSALNSLATGGLYSGSDYTTLGGDASTYDMSGINALSGSGLNTSIGNIGGTTATQQGQLAGLAAPSFTSGATGTQNILGDVGLGLQGIQTIGGLIGAFGSLSLANKQYDLQKSVLNTNLSNQIAAYNTTLADKERSRAVMEGQTSGQQSAYLAANQLPAAKLG